MKYLITLAGIFFIQFFSGQTILNGNFENNTAGNDQINLSNSDCNLKLKDVNSFGSYGDVDIITSSTYGGSGAQNGLWYVALTGGGTDIIALKLSSPIKEGQSYTLSFYDRKTSGYQAYPVQIGLSTTNNSFGTSIHSGSEISQTNVWTQRSFSFNAPHNGEYLTVQMAGTLNDWVNIDNFILTPHKCSNSLKIMCSSTTVTAGSSVTLTAIGGSTYTWAPVESLISKEGDKAIANPQTNTTYEVSSKQRDCPLLTTRISVQVVLPEIPKHNDSSIVTKKTDTLENSPPVSIIQKKNKKRFNSHRVNGRRFIIQESLTVSTPSVKILVWDKNRVDGDQVSLYLNGEPIAENFTVSKTKKEITLNLEPGKNIIVMYALNLGLVPPNTSALSINDGSKNKQITLVSDLKKSGALEVIYDPLALTHK